MIYNMKKIVIFSICMFLVSLSIVNAQEKQLLRKKSSTKNQIVSNFKIVSIGQHGFSIDSINYSDNEMIYSIELEIKNQTPYKLKQISLIGGILTVHSICRSYHGNISPDVNFIWLPQKTAKIILVLKKDFCYGDLSFEHTPKRVSLTIHVAANNIELDFDEDIITYDILNDWKEYQRKIGLRD